ncbi:MAG: rhodanese-like domain-containing protein [Candidatus Pristimantibacillus sp.]
MENQNFGSLVLETPAALPSDIYQHYLNKLSMETDVSDVMLDMERGVEEFILVDVRSPKAYAECHIYGSRSLPYRLINEESTALFAKEKVIVVYCWSPACNAATKAAVRLSALGFQVKEMIGGIEYWRKEGGRVEGSLGEMDLSLIES